MNSHSFVRFTVVIRSESHDMNDKISNLLNLSYTTCEEHIKKISDIF